MSEQQADLDGPRWEDEAADLLHGDGRSYPDGGEES